MAQNHISKLFTLLFYIILYFHFSFFIWISTYVRLISWNSFEVNWSNFVSLENISLHFQTFILPLIVIIQWMSDNSQCSTQRSDLIIIQSVWNDMKKQNKLRQTKSRRTVATSPRCFKRPTCKQKSHWIITINGQINVWKRKLIFPTDTLQKKIEITDLKPFFFF